MRAVSPIIAVVIIVAAAVALSVALALWMIGVVGSNTGVERLEIVSSHARMLVDKYTMKRLYRVVVAVRNTGPREATITAVFINNKPIEYYGGAVNLTGARLPVTLKPGEKTVIQVNVSAANFSHGQVIEVRIRTASGRDYYRMIQLP